MAYIPGTNLQIPTLNGVLDRPTRFPPGHAERLAVAIDALQNLGQMRAQADAVSAREAGDTQRAGMAQAAATERERLSQAGEMQRAREARAAAEAQVLGKAQDDLAAATASGDPAAIATAQDRLRRLSPSPAGAGAPVPPPVAPEAPEAPPSTPAPPLPGPSALAAPPPDPRRASVLSALEKYDVPPQVKKQALAVAGARYDQAGGVAGYRERSEAALRDGLGVIDAYQREKNAAAARQAVGARVDDAQAIAAENLAATRTVAMQNRAFGMGESNARMNRVVFDRWNSSRDALAAIESGDPARQGEAFSVLQKAMAGSGAMSDKDAERVFQQVLGPRTQWQERFRLLFNPEKPMDEATSAKLARLFEAHQYNSDQRVRRVIGTSLRSLAAAGADDAALQMYLSGTGLGISPEFQEELIIGARGAERPLSPRAEPSTGPKKTPKFDWKTP